MDSWHDRRILDLFGIDLPILQAPMAGVSTPEMAIAVSEAGGLGSLACAQLSVEQARKDLATIRQGTKKSINVNFFCHTPPAPEPARIAAWRKLLAPYYRELGLDPDAPIPETNRVPFDDAFCAVVEEVRPEVVSFHFGLPAPALLARVRATGAKIISSATTVAEARWLAERDVDAVIAMGLEAGGHRGNFLSDDIGLQMGTFALVPQIVDTVKVPVIAAGGISDARGIVAAFALGAAAVQIGTAYMLTPEAKVTELHRQTLRNAGEHHTLLTTLFTGRQARGFVNRLMRDLGATNPAAPSFPLAAGALLPLKAKAEAAGSGDFTNLWSGQAASLAKEMTSRELTRYLAKSTLEKLTA
ncbi:MAG TPA: nitronate monooxygenase [Dongiaceae bacterium]|nr:nitronate monooxygenase [Dongiaceae bacterium]